MLSPAHIAWSNSGKPDLLGKHQKYVEQGQCSHCGNDEPVVAIKRVASTRFPNWDSYSNIDKPLWCNKCLWAFSEATNRSEALFITPEKLISSYQPQSMIEFLSDPFDEFTCFSVALRKSKHVLPYAQWGSISIEDCSFLWTAREIKWLQEFIELKMMGFSIGDIKNYDSPVFSIVSTLDKEEARKAYKLWNNMNSLKKLAHIFSFIYEINKTATMEYKTY